MTAAALPPAAASRRAQYTRQYVLPQDAPAHTHLVLYYAYRALAQPELLADEHIALCASLQLSGRVLLAPEGINGTLSGSAEALETYVEVLCEHTLLRMLRTDFKLSAAAGAADPFSREMFVLCVPEIVASGGLLASIPLEATGQGYLTPAQWRDALRDGVQPDTLLIDVRNAREVAMGSFAGSTDPETQSFAEFPAWVEEHEEELRGKHVLMFCTGGVRCEKASAWLRGRGVASDVHHLQGGIHRYLEAYGEDGVWRGQNYVFDRRGAQEVTASRFPVGRCVTCAASWEVLDGLSICTVCLEPLLHCDSCRAASPAAELHCSRHAHLSTCFFRTLSAFSSDQLAAQLKELEDRILKLLRESTGNILDDEVLINTLNNSKQTSGAGWMRGRGAVAGTVGLWLQQLR